MAPAAAKGGRKRQATKRSSGGGSKATQKKKSGSAAPRKPKPKQPKVLVPPGPPPVPEEGFESHAFAWMGVTGDGGVGVGAPSTDETGGALLPSSSSSSSLLSDAIVLLGPSSPVPLRPLGPNDVLSGRGPDVNRHEGNRRYRALIVSRKDDYARARKLDKAAVALDVVRTVTQCWGGAFVRKLDKGETESMCGLGDDMKAALDAYDAAMGDKKASSVNRWIDIGTKSARDKVSQALRQQKHEVFTDTAELLPEQTMTTTVARAATAVATTTTVAPPPQPSSSPSPLPLTNEEAPEKVEEAREAATREMKCGKCRGILVAATACGPCGCVHCAGCVPEPEPLPSSSTAAQKSDDERLRCPSCSGVVASRVCLPSLDRMISSCVRGGELLANFTLEELEGYERRWNEILKEKEDVEMV